MLAKNIKIGSSYRHKDHPNYCWAKAVKVLMPKECENTTNRIVIKCEYSQDKNNTIGLIKYFKPSDLVKV